MHCALIFSICNALCTDVYRYALCIDVYCHVSCVILQCLINEEATLKYDISSPLLIVLLNTICKPLYSVTNTKCSPNIICQLL